MFTRIYRNLILTGLSLCSLAGPLPRSAEAQVNVLTHHNDVARTGQNLAEKQLTTSNVNVARFGKLFERPVDSNLWCQPLYVSGLNMPGKGVRNVVFVQTEVGQFYAFDADNAAETTPFWRRDLAPTDFSDSVSTPVINLATQTVYTVVRREANGTVFFTFHGLDIVTGADKFVPLVVTATVPGVGKGSVNGQLTFNSDTQKQRPALLDFNGVIYAAFGGSFDQYDPSRIWNGWIFGFDTVSGAMKLSFTVAPDRNGGGIWQAGNGLATDGTYIYAITANGGGDPLSNSSHEGGRDYGNSAIKLLPNPAKTALTVVDFWTPWNFQFMEDSDQDLGSGGPLLIPGTNLLMTGGKFAHAYLLNRNDLGKYTPGTNNIVQDIPAFKGHLHGGTVYWNSPVHGPLVYGWAEHDYMKAFKVLGNQGLQPQPIMKSSIQVPPGMPGGMLSVSADASKAGTGIIWSSSPLIGDANLAIVPGVLRAFDASDLSRELWNSEIKSSRDKVGFHSKFSPPTVANGKVYLSSFYEPTSEMGAKLLVYGLLPPTAQPEAPRDLAAAASVSRVNLSWRPVTGATAYNLRRSTVPGGPYNRLAPNLTTNSYEDTGVTNGITYYYKVFAANSGGEGPGSNQAQATPYAPAAGTVLSVDFVGGNSTYGFPQPMGAEEVAGAVPASHWNAAAGTNGTINGLRTNGGALTSVGAAWQSQGTFSSEIPETPGNYRMMRGYLSNENGGETVVEITNIPASFTTQGYDMYVYCDGANTSATRSALVGLGNSFVRLTDSQNRDFDGTFFLPGIDDVGNYILFRNLSAPSLRIVAMESDSTDPIRRVPVNGIQLVARQSPPAPNSVPQDLVAVPHNALIDLTWTGVAEATNYKIKRALSRTGPFLEVGTSPGPAWTDPAVRNGTEYFYVVSALVGGQDSANSQVASAIPRLAYSGRVISMDFGGDGTRPMDAGETAGAPNIGRRHWNRTPFPAGGLGDLKNDFGQVTTADVTWNAQRVGDLSIADAAGNNRMMRGYLDSSTTPSTVNIYNLPANHISKGYDVYVYTDSNNPTTTRSARFALDAKNYTVTDAAGSNFSGTYVVGNRGVGNLVKFSGLTSPNFTVTSTPVSASDGVLTAPINGLQVVARNKPSEVLTLTPALTSSVVNTSKLFTSSYRDLDGVNDMYTSIRIGGGNPGQPFFLANYNPLQNKLYIRNDANVLIGGFTPGSANTISNSFGTLNCLGTKVSRQGTTITITWQIIPKAPLVGKRWMFLIAGDSSGNNTGWVQKGTWTITAPAATAPAPSGSATAPKVPSAPSN